MKKVDQKTQDKSEEKRDVISYSEFCNREGVSSRTRYFLSKMYGDCNFTEEEWRDKIKL